MNLVFGCSYAGAYDAIYHDKDYSDECSLLERVFRRFDPQPIRSVLDLGCGTGGHALILAERGYEVIGVDCSEAMLFRLREKASATHTNIECRQADIRDVDLGRRFDAVVMMFAVLGYQLENDDVRAALTVARRHLDPGRLLVFDIWFGPAVLDRRPEDRIKTVSTATGQLSRKATGSLDLRAQVCTVEYSVSDGGPEARERHRMRYFFAKEIDLLLEVSGFETVRLGAFPDIDREADETTWDAIVVARAR